MTKVKFVTLAVGDQFVFNGQTYTKSQPKKVSCCKTLNAVKLESNEQVMIKPVEMVEKVNPPENTQN